MLRSTLFFFIAAQLLICLAGSPLFQCSEKGGCSIRSMRSLCCATSAQKHCPIPEKKQDNSPNAPASSSGCCICKPGCCVFLVPEAPKAVSFAVGGDFYISRFGTPAFTPQFVYHSIWKPPATLV